MSTTSKYRNHSTLTPADRVLCSSSGHLHVRLDVNAGPAEGSLLAIYRVTVTILDVDDNGPTFNKPRWRTSREERFFQAGRQIALPKAFDVDLNPAHRQIVYRLEMFTDPPDVWAALWRASEREVGAGLTTNSRPNTRIYPNSAPETPFQLRLDETGRPLLRLIYRLDAELVAMHRLVLVALPATASSPANANAVSLGPRPSRSPSHPGARDDQEARLLVEIEVLDSNDNEPHFDQPVYNVSVPESEPVGSIIYRVSWPAHYIRYHTRHLTTLLPWLVKKLGCYDVACFGTARLENGQL
ncbi:unnamed protein product [Protopolystoma xenopodis]|uniref:Cadherin domain-containing protein n=1 Tax=Protopolystoma xenopodis TaxID=117903 RepID=A0A448XFY4_9PLAT|nr:unnamed protein product [Protopolystoma xenopodis]